jgi:hypothetical protein
LFPRFFGITNTFSPVLSPPELELELAADVVELEAAALLLDAEEVLLLEDPHAATATTAAANAAASPNDRPICRPGIGRFPTSCI